MSEDGNALLQLLHQHYKDTFDLIRNWERRRDRMLLVVVALLGVLHLGLHYPQTANAIVAATAIDSTTALDLPSKVLVSVAWALLFIAVLRHSQAAITRDWQNDYLHKVEEKMGSLVDDDVLFQREGRAYLESFPAFSWWAWRFYTVVAPVITALAAGNVFLVEFHSATGAFNLWFDGTMAAGIGLSLFLHRVWPLLARLRPKSKTASVD